jgi:hypothetical protein
MVALQGAPNSSVQEYDQTHVIIVVSNKDLLGSKGLLKLLNHLINYEGRISIRVPKT